MSEIPSGQSEEQITKEFNNIAKEMGIENAVHHVNMSYRIQTWVDLKKLYDNEYLKICH